MVPRDADGPPPPADTPLPPTPPTPTSVRRVGGGYEFQCSARATEAAELTAVYELYRALPPSTGPLTAAEVTVLADVLLVAEAEADSESSKIWLVAEPLGPTQPPPQPPTLSAVLRAYARVLHSLGFNPDADTRLYRALLRLALDRNETDWWARLFRELGSSCRRHGAPPETHHALVDALLARRMASLGPACVAEWAVAAGAATDAAPLQQGQQEEEDGLLSPHSCASRVEDEAARERAQLELAVHAWREHACVAGEGGPLTSAAAVAPSPLPSPPTASTALPLRTSSLPTPRTLMSLPAYLARPLPSSAPLDLPAAFCHPGPSPVAEAKQRAGQHWSPTPSAKYPLVSSYVAASPTWQSGWAVPPGRLSPRILAHAMPLPLESYSCALPAATLPSWTHHHHHHQQQQQQQQQWARLGDAALMRKHLGAWRCYVAALPRHQATAIIAEAHRQLLHCIWQWLLLVHASKEAGQRGTAHWRAKTLCSCFRLWRGLAANVLDLVRKADHHCAVQRRRRMLHEWRTTATRQALLHHIGIALAGKVTKATAQSVLLAWCRVTQQRSSNKDIIARCLDRMHHQTTAAAFASWKGWAASRVLARRFAVQIRCHLAAACLRHWRCWLQKRAALQAKLAAAAQHRQHRQLTLALALWRERAAHWAARREQLHHALAAMRSTKLWAVWTGWRGRTSDWAAKRTLLASCVDRMQQFRLQGALEAWRCRSHWQREAKAKLSHCIAVLM